MLPFGRGKAWGDWQVDRSSSGFGTITSSYDPCQMQLGLKVLW